jgi:hypothetical protein
MEDRMITWKTALKLITKFLLYSLIIMLVDFAFIFALTRGTDQITYTLSFVMLIEGGIALIVGGAAASYSPLSAKLSEVIFHTKPWNARRQKEVETNARAWITAGIILVLEALLLSAF